MRWRLIDRIVECVPGVSAIGHKTFPPEETLFEDHFPGFPIVPGVLQIEMIAQLAGKCAAMAVPSVLPVLGSVRTAKFYRNVKPGDLCVISARVEKSASTYILGSGEITVNGERVASASMLFGLVDRRVLASENFDEVTQTWLRENALPVELSQ